MVFSKIRDVLISLLAGDDSGTLELERMTAAEFSKRAESLKIGRELPHSIVLFEYGSPIVKKAVWEIKFRGNGRIARLVAALLYGELLEKLSEEKVFSGALSEKRPLLVPVPVSARRRRERGWNQCEIIAGELAKLDGGDNFELRTDILVKNKNTADQVGKGRFERLKNLENAFAVKDAKALEGRLVILLDDVITTGATMEEAGRTLAAHGAKKILFLAIAH